MTLREFVDQLYITLLDNGYHLNEIDDMDIIYYLDLMKKRVQKETTEEFGYIDDVL
jgi:hypothetical protein